MKDTITYSTAIFACEAGGHWQIALALLEEGGQNGWFGLIYNYMYVYRCVHIYIHAYLYIFLIMYRCMYIDIYIHIYIYVCVLILFPFGTLAYSTANHNTCHKNRGYEQEEE